MFISNRTNLLAQGHYLPYPVNMIIRLEKPTLRRKDMDAVLQTMADEQIGVGDHTLAFTTLLQEKMHRAGYVTALRDRIHALSYALIGIGITAGSVVGVSALSPDSTRQSSIHLVLLWKFLISIQQPEISHMSELPYSVSINWMPCCSMNRTDVCRLLGAGNTCRSTD